MSTGRTLEIRKSGKQKHLRVHRRTRRRKSDCIIADAADCCIISDYGTGIPDRKAGDCGDRGQPGAFDGDDLSGTALRDDSCFSDRIFHKDKKWISACSRRSDPDPCNIVYSLRDSEKAAKHG